MTLPNVNNGSGLDNPGTRESIAPTVANENTRVNPPTEIINLRDDQTVVISAASGLFTGLNQLLFIV